jgi:D-glycero-D-manno-heptose 1,7-bisphosphate phosphatase
MFPALFLDRDGVVIEFRLGYVRTWEDVTIFPQALKALSRASHSGYRILIVTNQSVIGRGIVSPETVDRINQGIVLEIKRAGGRVDGVFVCPHAPDDNCSCRKPQPGLILQSAQELDIDLNRSILIGDNLTDLQAGAAAGVGRLVLVLTGLGEQMKPAAVQAGLPHFYIYTNLEEALDHLIFSEEKENY